MLTHGLRCPGCGSQRAIHELLHLHFGDAFRYNPLVILSIPYLALLGIANAVKGQKPKFYNTVNNSFSTKSVLVITLTWWVARNIWGW